MIYLATDHSDPYLFVSTTEIGYDPCWLCLYDEILKTSSYVTNCYCVEKGFVSVGL
jgi:hypothetical protein